MNQETYEGLAEESPALLAVFDDGGHFRWANASWTRDLGWKPSELRGRSFESLVHPADLEALRHARRGAAETSPSDRHRARLCHANGTWRWVDWFLAAFGKGYFYARELTAVIATEERLSRKLQLLELSEEVAGVGHWTYTVSTGQVTWSPQVYQIFGRDPAEPPSIEAALAQYHPDDRARGTKRFKEIVEAGGAFVTDIRLVRTDGSLRHVVSRGRCTVDPTTGQTQTVFGTFLDVTERDQEHDQLARERRLVTVGTLAAGVGHEMNNPLTYVTANLDEVLEEFESLAGGSPSGRQRVILERLGEVRQGVDRLTRIVRGLRAFAREDGPPKPTVLRPAIELAVDMAMHEIRHRATCEVEHGDVPLVEADDSRIAQVLVNLLANAAQAFAAADRERNRIEVRTQRDGDAHVIVTVTDNGPGIAPEVLPRIFDPFFTTKPVGQGTGLGLAISLSVVHSVGGELTCASKLGEGTTFTLRLRVASPAPEEAPARFDEVAPALHVVVIDDERVLAAGVARILRREGYRVTSFDDPRAALASLDAAPPDLVLCDVMMPYLTGADVYHAALLRNPSLAPRFVFMSGGATRPELRAFLAEVDNEFIEKPFHVVKLREAIGRALARLA